MNRPKAEVAADMEAWAAAFRASQGLPADAPIYIRLPGREDAIPLAEAIATMTRDGWKP